jgi:RHS repeat-associated protein
LYAYDNLNQLTSFERGTLNGTKTGLTGSASRSQAWDFDALGNFDDQATNGTSQTRTHNKQNEITAVTGATTPTYDANGSLTTDEAGRTFKYDAWNRLVEVRDSGNNLTGTYRFDGLTRRIRETHGSTTTDLYYSAGWQVLEERVGSAVQASYAWSPVYVDAMIARDRDTDANGSLDERLYVAQDANFNVTALIDASGSVVERYAQDPFSGFVVLSGSWGSRSSSLYGWQYQHQGLRWDAVTGAYNVRNRELSPTLGRWLQMDPIGFAGGDINMYAAYGAEPLSYVDPSGLQRGGGRGNGGGSGPRPPGSPVYRPDSGYPWVNGPYGPAPILRPPPPPPRVHPVTPIIRPWGPDYPFPQPKVFDRTQKGPIICPALEPSPVPQAKRKLKEATYPVRDGSGKIHGVVPDYVPRSWSCGDLEDAIAEVIESLIVRQEEQRLHPHDPGHQERIRRETNWLEKLLRRHRDQC